MRFFPGVALGALLAALPPIPLTLLAPDTPRPTKSNEGWRSRALHSGRYRGGSKQEGRKFSRQVAEGRLKAENGLT